MSSKQQNSKLKELPKLTKYIQTANNHYCLVLVKMHTLVRSPLDPVGVLVTSEESV